MLASFSLLFIASTLLGIFGGLACAFFLKQMRIFRLNRVQEISLIIFFAFITYSVTDLIGFSPIIALLFCGIFMSHYAFYNISFQAREETSIVTKLMSNIAEGFVFAYLGLTSVSTISASFSFSFIFCILIFVMIGRFASIYGLSFLLK
jgi:NhaP-type Na+/H+ or K+/H+ antiporter